MSQNAKKIAARTAAMRASGRLALSRKALNVPIPMTRDTHQDFSNTRELASDDAYYVRLGLPRVRYELSGSQPALDPNCPNRVLGTCGVCDFGRPVRRYYPHTDSPADAIYYLVSWGGEIRLSRAQTMPGRGAPYPQISRRLLAAHHSSLMRT